jgi:hypothetical protein
MAMLKNSRKRHTVRRLIIAPAMLALVTGLSSMSHAQNERLGSRFEEARVNENQARLVAPIEGTWILTIHRMNQGITFSALQSFTAGGVTVATGTVDRTPPPPISPLYGSWKRTGHNRYASTICFFFFDDAGNALGMIKTPASFRMEEDNHLTGSGTGLACDVNGDNCVDLNSTITFTGKRLMAEGASN